ncbi:unnamed protein product [Porites evermanni]|uniref:F5/8 type C domain-containing protein n=1 Tax=Porites evermanni TaxID=104178 RepID=A0ABN8MGM6_9CNID|nr:unnamed protein product [Porites evermanni]
MNQWATKYKLQYRNNSTAFQYYKENGQVEDKLKSICVPCTSYLIPNYMAGTSGSTGGVGIDSRMKQKRRKVFTGNTDRNIVVCRKLNKPIRARYVCVHRDPIAWHGHISMRVELFGCNYTRCKA